jgi:hypothetical protein
MFRKTMEITKLLATLIFILVQNTFALKILVYNPRFGLSHVKFMGNLADLLAEQGHDVVSLINLNEQL